LKLSPQEAWQLNDPELESWWNPIEVIEQTTIPVLAFFGDKDTQIESNQGAHAYREALERAGNPNSRVELIPVPPRHDFGGDRLPGRAGPEE